MTKRPLKDVAETYARRLISQPARRMKAEHVVAVLTQQHGGGFPVALNHGTRPTVCRKLGDVLGTARYEALCTPGTSEPPDVPSLPGPSATAEPTPPAPTLDELRARLPADAKGLLADGAQLFDLLTQGEVQQLVAQLAGHAEEGKTQSLTDSQGNGRNGRYATLARPLPPVLQRTMDAAREWIEAHASPLKRGLGGKALLLRYAEGGINYAHHDASGDFQALLMLSSPGVDYRGGSFYLAQREPPFDTADFPFASPGQLLVFRGNRGHAEVDYLHGMRLVERGSAATCRRFAVGLFQ
jgi:hypothetical protein